MLIAGLDEVGMGCLAGPVLVSITVFDDNFPPVGGLDDSKKLSADKRRSLFDPIFEAAQDIGLGFSDNKVIDEFGIREAWNRAIDMAVGQLHTYPERTYIDGSVTPRSAVKKKHRLGQVLVFPKADGKIWQVSAASIVAKVIRDDWMKELGIEHPNYDFKHHKGYGTKEHMKRITKFGMSCLHRKTFCRNIPQS